MPREHKLVIVGRRDLDEEYLAEIIRTEKQLTGSGIDPIVRILAVLRYPRQSAIYFPDVPMEIHPVPGDTVCRLPFLRDATDEEKERFGSYDESLAAARREYLRSCTNAEERERILQGRPRIRRSLMSFKEYDI